MDHQYDIFEQLPDGTLLWKAVVDHIEAARAKLVSTYANSAHECFAMHIPTNTIVARINVNGEQETLA